MMKCLIADHMYGNIEELLTEIGVEPVYKPNITREEMLSVIRDYEGLMIRSKTQVDRELLENASRLRFVARAGAGIDNLDEDILRQKDIAMINAPEGNRSALGEHAVGLLLALLNNIVKGDREIRKGIWDREGNRAYELGSMVVGLLGYGHMGMFFARKLKSFGCRVLAYDKYKTDYGDEYAEEALMDEIYEKADIFSLHVPLTGETRGLVNFDYLNRFEKNIYLINTSRGEVLPLTALCTALEKGKVKGAALDVLENEKINRLNAEEKKSFQYLAESNKTILTPHVAGWSFESYRMINEVLVAKINALINAQS